MPISLLGKYRYLRNREHLFRVRYLRSHPHLLITIFQDALLTIVLVFGAIYTAQAVASRNPGNGMGDQGAIMLVHSGVISLDAEQLVSHERLPGHLGDELWIGPIEGNSYTTNCVNAGKLIVTYFTPGELATDGSVKHLSVTVYENAKFFTTDLRPLHADPTQTETNSQGDTLSFSPNNMLNVRVTNPSSDEIVVIQYPSARSLSSMMEDSLKLRPVSSSKSKLEMFHLPTGLLS